MDSLEIEKKRIKEKRKYNIQDETAKQKNNYINILIMRLLLAVIIFFGTVILINLTDFGNYFIKEIVLKENISFSHINNLYNKYFGNIIPLNNLINDESTVFNEKLEYSSIDNYENGYSLTVKNNYLVPVLSSGIVVFIGEKEGLGNTVIVQGIDEIDYWYSNIDNISNKLYDYVSKGEYLATTNKDNLILTFKKGSEYLDFNEVME